MPVKWLHVSVKHDSLTLTEQRHLHSGRCEVQVVMELAPCMVGVGELRCKDQEHAVKGGPLGPDWKGPARRGKERDGERAKRLGEPDITARYKSALSTVSAVDHHGAAERHTDKAS